MNIANLFVEYTNAHPHKEAFILPKDSGEEIVTYKQFYDLVSRYREGLIKAGHKKGDRIILLMPIDLEFYAVMMALFSLGLVAVFLDPGIGIKKMLVAIADSKAKTVISIDRFLKMRFLLPMLWGKKLYSKDSKGLFLKSFSELKSSKQTSFEAVSLNNNDHFLITFTSGSTGRSKGSDRNTENVYNQIKAIQNLWPSDSSQVDFSSFLMFGFMNLGFGITTILPPMDFTKVGEVDEKRSLELIKKYKVTRLSGSAAFLSKISKFIVESRESIETIKNTAQGGSPVSEEFCLNMKKAFPLAENLVVYGSTEVAPISTCEMEKLLTAPKKGALVGRPEKSLTVEIVRLPETISSFKQGELESYVQKLGEWGEIIIKGPHVVKGYVDNEKATLENKIKDYEGKVWHRTGDVGFFDEEGQLWITGRLSELVKINDYTLHPYIVEANLNECEGVRKSALINTKNGPRLVIEKEANFEEEKFHKKRQDLAIDQIKISFVDKIPVDVRHSSKIDRIKLQKMVV